MPITLGNFNTDASGRTTVSDLNGSGLDTQGLINGLVDARSIPQLNLLDRIELNSSKVDAYSTLRGVLSSLQDAANFLRNPPGVQNDADNVFRYRAGALTSSTGIPASDYLGVSVEPGASIQNYNITDITSLARVTKQRTSAFSIASPDSSVTSAATTPGFFKAGTVTINGADITLVAGDSLNQVAAKFNEEQSATGIEASIIQSSTNEFILSFTATDSGTANAFDLNDAGTVTDPDGVLSFINTTELVTGGAFGGNLITNGTFDTDISDFSDASLGTGVIAHDGIGALQLDGDGAGGNEAFAQQALTTEIGKTYTVSLDVADLASSAYIRVGTDGDVSLGANSDLADVEVTADGKAVFTFTATSETSYITVNSDANTDPITIDNLAVADISDFTNASLGTGSISPNTTGGLSLNGGGAGGNEAFVQQSITTEVGKSYTVTGTLADLTNSAYFRVGSDGDVSLAANSDLADFEITADGEFSFTFTATDTTSYLTLNSDTNTTPFSLDNLSVSENGIDQFADTQSAQDAVFVIDGITVTRSTNSISDVIDRVTFSLLQATPDQTEIGLDIVADTSLPQSGVLNFIEAYNQLRIFVTQQRQVGDDGTFAEDSFLAAESLLRSIDSAVSAELATAVSGAGSLTSLADVGVTFNDLPQSGDTPFTRNILNIDTDAFISAISSNFEDVANLFGYNFTTSNSNVTIFQSTNNNAATEFSLNIDPDADIFQAIIDGETIDLVATEVGSSGYTLTGAAGSALDSVTLIYASTTAGTADVNINQGIADRIFNVLENALDPQEGSLGLAVDNIEGSTTRFETEVARLDRQLEDYREFLVRQFSALEVTLSGINTLLDSLTAQQDALNNG